MRRIIRRKNTRLFDRREKQVGILTNVGGHRAIELRSEDYKKLGLPKPPIIAGFSTDKSLFLSFKDRRKPKDK